MKPEDVNSKLTAERLREVLLYEPETGAFFWREKPSKNATRSARGQIAGNLGEFGYRRIRLDGRTYSAHRLAWFFVYGEWPAQMVDHINGQKDDNKISNLRVASRAENRANAVQRNRTLKFPKGVRKNGNGFGAMIGVDKKQIWLGTFPTVELASAAYLAAAKKYFGEFAHSGKKTTTMAPLSLTPAWAINAHLSFGG